MLKRGWAWFRGLPTKAQVIAWVVVAVIVIGLAASPSEETSETGETTPTTTTSTAAPEPPPTTAPETMPAPPPGYVSREMLGDEWPLTVEDGTLRCDGPAVAGAIFFQAEGRWYPVNGIARGRSEGIEIDVIWADDPDIPGAKKHIGVLIERGLELCE